MIYAEERNQLLLNANIAPERIVDFGRSAEKEKDSPESTGPGGNGLIHFFSELRRRRVCRALTLYAVAMWVICQIVELLAPQLGLPEWTLSMVIVLGLLGLPIAMVLSWLFDITPEGVVVDDGTDRSATSNTNPRGRLDRVIDCSLVLAALVIGVQLAFVAVSTASVAASAPFQKIAIEPFRAATGSEANALAQGLVTDLQHEIVSKTAMTVIVPRESRLAGNTVSLAGSISVDEDRVRVTATLIDNHSGEVTWSSVIQLPRSDALTLSAEIARAIVVALPHSMNISGAGGERHES